MVLKGWDSSRLAFETSRDNHAAGVRIFGHCYDCSIPHGRGLCDGLIDPWLKPSFDFCGWHGLKKNTAATAQGVSGIREIPGRYCYGIEQLQSRLYAEPAERQRLGQPASPKAVRAQEDR